MRGMLLCTHLGSLPVELRWSLVRTSLSRSISHDSQIGLSLIARSTFVLE